VPNGRDRDGGFERSDRTGWVEAHTRREALDKLPTRWMISGAAENKNWRRVQDLAEELPRHGAEGLESTIRRFRRAGSVEANGIA